VDFCLQLVLKQGLDKEFFQEQAKRDLRLWLAPWLAGNMERFVFGQPLFRSDVIRFLEGLSYIDYLLDLEMVHHGDPLPTIIPDDLEPLTPRSILVAGEIVVDIPDPLPNPGDPPVGACDNVPIPVVDRCPQEVFNESQIK
jgi:hypothetical protein